MRIEKKGVAKDDKSPCAVNEYLRAIGHSSPKPHWRTISPLLNKQKQCNSVRLITVIRNEDSLKKDMAKIKWPDKVMCKLNNS